MQFVDKSNNKIIISIEGNIGVGKSTFISILKRKFPEHFGESCEIIYEPVEIWTNITDSNGKNILQTFYDDMSRWAYSFQNIACISRMNMMEQAICNSSSKYIFLDRSLGTDSNVFEAMLYDDGFINKLEHEMYKMWTNFYSKHVRPDIKPIYIYLKANTKTCMERIEKRNRLEEKSITIEYLKKLEMYHDKWLNNNNNTIYIDCNDDFESDINKQNKMILQIKNKLFINSNKINYLYPTNLYPSIGFIIYMIMLFCFIIFYCKLNFLL